MNKIREYRTYVYHLFSSLSLVSEAIKDHMNSDEFMSVVCASTDRMIKVEELIKKNMFEPEIAALLTVPICSVMTENFLKVTKRHVDLFHDLVSLSEFELKLIHSRLDREA